MIWRKWIKWSALAITAIFLLILLSIGLWVRLRTVTAARELVRTLSNGQYGLDARKIRVDPFHMRTTAEKLHIYPLHTGNSNNEFEIKADSLSLELTAVLQLLIFNKLNVTSFSVVKPSLQVRVYAKNNQEKTAPVPLHREVAIIQDILFKVLESLKVKHFELKKGSIAYYPELNASAGRYYLNNINLEIDNLHLLEKFTSGKLQEKAAIHLELLNPSIEYPDSTIRVDLQRLDWNTRFRNLEIDGLGFHKSIITQSDSSGFQLRDISLDSMNWNKLLTTGIVELGELRAGNGKFSSNNFSLKKRKKDSLVLENNSTLLDIIGPIQIKKLSINEIEFTGNTHTKRGKETIRISGEDLVINRLLIDKELPNKIQLDNLNLKVRAYLETGSNKTFRSGFSEIDIQNKNLFLKDYYLYSLTKNRYGENKIDVKELELKELSIAELLDGKLKARELVLGNPTLQILVPAEKKSNNELDWQKLQNKINKKLDIGLIRINNAHVLVIQENKTVPLFRTDSFYAIIASRNILRSQSLEELFSADNSFSMPKLAIRLPGIDIDLTEAEYANNSLSAASATGITKNRNLRFLFKTVRVGEVNMPNILNKKDSGLFRILNIGNGEVFITIPDSNSAVSNNSVSQIVRSIYTGPIRFHITAPKWNLQTKLDSIYLEQLMKKEGTWIWQDYLLKGSSILIQHPILTGNSGDFTLGNQINNSLHSCHFEWNNPTIKLVADIPDLAIRQHIQSTKDITAAIESLTMFNPMVDAVIKQENSADQPSGDGKSSYIPAISLVNPTLHLSKDKGDSLHLIASAKGGKITIDPITINHGNVNFEGLQLDLNNILTKQEKFDFQIPFLKLSTGKLKLAKGEPIHTNIQALVIQEGKFDWHTSTKQLSAKGIYAKIDKGFWFNSSGDSLKRLLTTLPHLTFSTSEFLYLRPGRQLKAHQLNVSSDKKQISFDSMHWIGTIPRDSFFKAAMVQKDFFNLRIGKGILNGYEMVDRGRDTVWTINQLNLFDFNALIERNKQYPVDSIKFRPLMTGMLQEIPLRFALERTVLANSKVRYNEINEKSGKEGSIWFSDMNATIRNIRNFDINMNDSLTLIARTKLMDKGNLQLSFRESYTDSLRGFFMLARMGKMDLNVLSPLLLPLFNLKIDRGYVDSLWLRVKANDYLAYGKMEMDYRKLKLSLLNDEGNKKGFSSFLINTVLRSNNDKTGLVYRERLRNKSMFNYWGKIAMSGLLTNMGVQKNKKQVKKYNNEMKALNLPTDLLEE